MTCKSRPHSRYCLLLAALAGLAGGLKTRTSAVSKVRELSQIFADFVRHHASKLDQESLVQRAKQQRLQQQELAKALNISQDGLSSKDLHILMQEVQTFALSAKKRYQLEAIHGVNTTQQAMHRKLLEPLVNMQSMNHQMKFSMNRTKLGGYWVADSTFKLVAVEALFWMAVFGGIQYKGGMQYQAEGAPEDKMLKPLTTEGAYILGSYYILSVLVYCDAGWPLVDAMHWATEVPTTIAWGDLSLDHGGNPVRPMQIWTTLHVIFTALIAANGMQDIFDSLLLYKIDNLIDNANHVVDQNDPLAISDAMSGRSGRITTSSDGEVVLETDHCPDDGKKILGSLGLWLAAIGVGAVMLYSYEECTCSYGPTVVDGCLEDDCRNTGGYTMTMREMLYFLVVSLSAVGFGDFSPKSHTGRLLGAVYFLVGNKISDHEAGNFDEAFKKAFGGPDSDCHRGSRTSDFKDVMGGLTFAGNILDKGMGVFDKIANTVAHKFKDVATDSVKAVTKVAMSSFSRSRRKRAL